MWRPPAFRACSRAARCSRTGRPGLAAVQDDGSAQVFDGIPRRPASLGLLDLTYRDIYNLWVERHRQLIEDGSTRPRRADRHSRWRERAQRRDGAALRSMYPLLVRRALFDAVAGLKVPPEGVVPSSDLFPAQRLPWQTGPQAENSWDGLRHTCAPPCRSAPAACLCRCTASVRLAPGGHDARAVPALAGHGCVLRELLVPGRERPDALGFRRRICNTCWARPCWAPITEPGRACGCTAQGRRLVGPEHGPSLRRRHHLDACELGSSRCSAAKATCSVSAPPPSIRASSTRPASGRGLDVWHAGAQPRRHAQQDPCHADAGLELHQGPWKACASRRPRGWRSSAAAPSPYLAGALSDRAAAGQVGAPVFRATQAALNKGSQEGFPSRLPFALMRRRRLCLRWRCWQNISAVIKNEKYGRSL